MSGAGGVLLALVDIRNNEHRALQIVIIIACCSCCFAFLSLLLVRCVVLRNNGDGGR